MKWKGIGFLNQKCGDRAFCKGQSEVDELAGANLSDGHLRQPDGGGIVIRGVLQGVSQDKGDSCGSIQFIGKVECFLSARTVGQQARASESHMLGSYTSRLGPWCLLGWDNHCIQLTHKAGPASH